VQAVPHLGEGAKELFVFQRTPSSVDVRANRATTPEFVSEFMSKPGWQKERMDNFTNMTQTNTPGVKDLIQDGWTKIMRNLNQEFTSKRRELLNAGAGPSQLKLVSQMMELADMKQMHAVRSRADEVVHDSETAEKLKPWYQQFCKRPCFHDEYLLTYNRPNVHLVHDPTGIEKFTETGIVANNGQEYKVDCIVFATGFEIGYDVLDCGYPIHGRGGIALSEKWQNGPRTLRSVNSNGFPNMFMQNAPQGTFTTNFVQKLDEEARHAAHVIAQIRSRGLSTFDVSKEAEDEWCEEIYRRSGRGQKFMSKCTPGYYNKEGKMGMGKSLNSMYSGPIKFFATLKELRESGRQFDGMDLA